MSIYKHRDDQQKYAEPGHSYAGALEASPPFLGRRLDFAAPRPRERSISHVVGCLRAVSAALICACVIARSLPNGLGDLATVLLNERPADTKGDAVGGVERGAAPFAFDSFAADRSVPRGADGLVGFRNYVLQLRFAPDPAVWGAASSSTSSPEPLPHEDAIAATTQVRRGAPRRASSGRTRATGASASARCSSSAARRRRASR